jgi:phosphomannomutase
MADAARARYCPDGKLHETAVGFQFLKGFIPTSINAWEESDGMSPMNWSRDKDGLMAALLLVAMVLDADQPAEALLAQTEEELGPFFFERQKVAGKLQGEALSAALKARFDVSEGTKLHIAGRDFAVAKVVRLDGTKIILDNGWWFGVRASGTEPVVRPYVETFAPAGSSADARQDALGWQQSIMSWLKEEITKVVS